MAGRWATPTAGQRLYQRHSEILMAAVQALSTRGMTCQWLEGGPDHPDADRNLFRFSAEKPAGVSCVAPPGCVREAGSDCVCTRDAVRCRA